jgi:hypothetical protein
VLLPWQQFVTDRRLIGAGEISCGPNYAVLTFMNVLTSGRLEDSESQWVSEEVLSSKMSDTGKTRTESN